VASCHRSQHRAARRCRRRQCGSSLGTLSTAMPANWIWIQIAIVLFVLIGIIIGITKLV
jgi:hypothetical protein